MIADLTDLQWSLLELSEIVSDYQLPFVPICQGGKQDFEMMADVQEKHTCILDMVTYGAVDVLINSLESIIIDPAIKKYNELKLIKAKDPRIRSVKDFLKNKKN